MRNFIIGLCIGLVCGLGIMYAKYSHYNETVKISIEKGRLTVGDKDYIIVPMEEPVIKMQGKVKNKKGGKR